MPAPPPFATYAQWMADTRLLVGSRNDFLKAVDSAYAAYDQAPTLDRRDALEEAFNRWRADRQRRGKPWEKSDRNHKGAITRLKNALDSFSVQLLSAEERSAMRAISDAQAAALRNQFRGKTVAFKRNTLVGMAGSAATAWQRAKTTAATVVVDGSGLAYTGYRAGTSLAGVASAVGTLQRQGAGAVHAAARDDFLSLRPKIIDFIAKLTPGLDPQQVFDALSLGDVEQFAANLAPVLGTLSSGGKALKAWTECAYRHWQQVQMEDRRFAFRPGDPEAAFDAVIALLDREVRAAAKRAGIHTTAMTGKALGLALDAGAASGPVLGLLETLAQIFVMIMDYVRDYNEVKHANLCIERGALDLTLFKTCPLLGCYFLLVQDHSTIISYAVGDYGRDGWQMRVEHLVGQIETVLERARHYVKVSRFELPGMENAKGVREANWSHRKGLDKVGSAPGALAGAVGDALGDRINEWRGRAAPRPPVDRARIVGIAWQA